MSGPVLRRACLTVAAWFAGGAAAFACPVCFQFDDPVAAAGVEAAGVVLAGITIAVLVPCGGFVVRFARRDALASRPDAEASKQ